MTLKELSQLYYLKKEIAFDQQRLEEIRAKAMCPASPNFDGMPKNNVTASSVERFTEEITDLEAIISAKQEQCVHEYNILERYIADIDDSFIRLIFELRFVKGLSWLQVAQKIGGYNTAQSVSKACYRYINKHSEQDG